MSISMNKSSEATTQLNLPISYIINSSLLDDYSLNSIYSPRPGSVTVIGKRVFSNSCISPNTIQEPSKFPIPIKSITRLKRQNNQVKLLLKKKTPKSKCPEQPPPPVPKLQIRNNVSMAKIKTSEKIKKKENLRIESVKPLEVKIDVAQTERSPKIINQIVKKSIKIEKKKQMKLEKIKNRERKVKIFKKLCLEERNSKIRAENSAKFKMEKFTPKAAWGVDERKFDDNEKVMKDIELQRQSRRAYKKSPEYAKRKALGLSKYWQVAEETGFRPRSSSIPKIETTIEKVKKLNDPKIKKFIKLRKKQEKEKQKNKLIDDVQKETKRLTGLKILDMRQYTSESKQKRTKKSVNIEIRPKRILFNQVEDDEVQKMEKDNSSDFVFEPDSALKKEVSGFTEDSVHVESEEKSPESDSLYLKETAAVKIQYFFRKYLNKKAQVHSKSIFYDEDTEVQNIITTWNASQSDLSKKEKESKSAFNSDQLLNLERMRLREIAELTELAKQISKDPNMVDSLTQLIGNCYQNIAEMLQNSSEKSDPSQSLESYIKDLGPSLEFRLQEIFNPQKTSEKSFQESNLTASTKRQSSSEYLEKLSNPTEIMVLRELQIEDKPFIEDPPRCELNPFKFPLISHSSPINLPECDEKVGKQLCIITSEYINDLTEGLIIQLMNEVVNVNQESSQLNRIDKDVESYIGQLINYIPEQDFIKNLSLPLSIPPTVLLSKIQESKYNECSFLPSACPAIIPNAVFDSLDSCRQLQLINKSLKDSQKAHDRLLYDCCNELLQVFRPYGLLGEPAPWSYITRIVSQEKKDFPLTMQLVKHQIEKENDFCAGKICDLSFCLNTSSVEEEGVQNMREEKIGVLILRDIKESEHLWVSYIVEEAQSLLELADWIFDLTILETINIVMDC